MCTITYMKVSISIDCLTRIIAAICSCMISKSRLCCIVRTVRVNDGSLSTWSIYVVHTVLNTLGIRHELLHTILHSLIHICTQYCLDINYCTTVHCCTHCTIVLSTVYCLGMNYCTTVHCCTHCTIVLSTVYCLGTNYCTTVHCWCWTTRLIG